MNKAYDKVSLAQVTEKHEIDEERANLIALYARNIMESLRAKGLYYGGFSMTKTEAEELNEAVAEGLVVSKEEAVTGLNILMDLAKIAGCPYMPTKRGLDVNANMVKNTEKWGNEDVVIH